ncbi:MAG: hypothetical protein R2769_10370 [Saprospiraceae bacterium]
MDERNEKQLKLLELGVRNFDALKKACETIVEQNVSNFPIMVLHQKPVEIGIEVIERDKVAGNWSVSASDGRIHRQILIQEEKLESFRSLCQSHKNQICLFW